MFSGCNTLSDINMRRQELIRGGKDPKEVNAAYNKAKKQLLDVRPTFRKIPTYTCKIPEPRLFTPIPFTKQPCGVAEIIVTKEGVTL